MSLAMLNTSKSIRIVSLGVRWYPLWSCTNVAKPTTCAVRLLVTSQLNYNQGKPSNDPKPQTLQAKFATDDPKMTAKSRLKSLITIYGPTAVVLHIGLSLSFLGATYLAVRFGFDVPGYLANRGYDKESYMMIIANGGSFGLAYALYKAAMPMRVPVTLILTPPVAHALQRYGIIKRKIN